MTKAVATTDHRVIRNWVEAREGQPALAGEGVLRIDFGAPEAKLEAIGWDEFFEIFDSSGLAFVHQDMLDDGRASRFNKFVERH